MAAEPKPDPGTSGWGARLMALAGRFEDVTMTVVDRFALSESTDVPESSRRLFGVWGVDVTDIVHDESLSVQGMLDAVARRVGIKPC